MVSGSVKRILGNSSMVLQLFIIVLQYYEYDFALLQYIDYDFALLPRMKEIDKCSQLYMQ